LSGTPIWSFIRPHVHDW